MADLSTQEDFIEALKGGVERTREFFAISTDYEGAPTKTEYLLTADIAREFVERGHIVRVEGMYRRLPNLLVALRAFQPRKYFKAMRADIVIMRDALHPLAIIEVKIRIKLLSAPLKEDLKKITDAISSMKAAFAKEMIGASVFQVAVSGKDGLETRDEFAEKITAIESKIEKQLREYSKGYSDFDFSFHPLLEIDQGIVERDVEYDESDNGVWGVHGQATMYYAILIRSIRPTPKIRPGFAGMKQRMLE